MRKQQRAISSLIFLSVLAVFCIGSTAVYSDRAPSKPVASNATSDPESKAETPDELFSVIRAEILQRVDEAEYEEMIISEYNQIIHDRETNPMIRKEVTQQVDPRILNAKIRKEVTQQVDKRETNPAIKAEYTQKVDKRETNPSIKSEYTQKIDKRETNPSIRSEYTQKVDKPESNPAIKSEYTQKVDKRETSPAIRSEYTQKVDKPESNPSITADYTQKVDPRETSAAVRSEYTQKVDKPETNSRIRSEYSQKIAERETSPAIRSEYAQRVDNPAPSQSKSSDYVQTVNEPIIPKQMSASEVCRSRITSEYTQTVDDSANASASASSAATVQSIPSSNNSNNSINTSKSRRESSARNAASQPTYAKPADSSDFSSSVSPPPRTYSASQNGSSIPTPRKNGSSKPAEEGCKYAPTCEFSTGVSVKVKNPQICQLGTQYAVEIEVLALVDVKDVVLIAKLPDGVKYVSSQAEAKVKGSELTWNFDRIDQGKTVFTKVMLKAEKEGELCTCVSVRSTANGCCSILCAKPVLTCEKNYGPEEVCPGDQVNYAVTVTNTGNFPAQDVVLVIKDTVNGEKPATFKIGTLEKGQEQKIDFPVTATKRGKLCYVATATASNADKAACDLCTLVTSCAIESRKEGPKHANIGQVADYHIIVTNTGDRPLHDLVVTDTPHVATTIVAAKGAEIIDKKAIWKIKELKAGDKIALNETLTCRSVGNYNSTTAVTNKERANSGCEYSTFWKGRAALDVSMSTSENSIFVGEKTRYKITVTNQGQEPDSNVVVAVIFPTGLEPVDSSGDSIGKIEGQNVVFAPTSLALRQTIVHYVTVKANGTGDLRPKVQVSSESIKTPITQEESLIVN